ncbi:MAG: peptidoglycan DD-metalloendopeptidase family protein [Tannerella sp.]|jgi:murein DD-endopeptidase MepM/ murein hydrolase activator NlpD|nr:peptidoglycan DD-metalloendopeptidase family protein [Tannerella sp.]
MKIHNTLLICCSLAIGLQTKAEDSKKNNKIQAQKASVDAARLDRYASELMANHVSPTKVGVDELAIARLDEYNEQLSRESLLFPADELYNSNWDTVNVNPFLKSPVHFPESYAIDCNTFTMPIDDDIKVTSRYGPRRRRMHRGIDLKVYVGDTIRAAFDGKVRIKSFERRGYGYYLVLRHPNGLETIYGHLSKFLVTENQIVRAGQAIGLGGNTGRSTGSHLHFETRFLGKDINPEEIIDFESGTPHKDEYVFYNVKINGKNSNIYSTSKNAIAVHRVRKGETLSVIARKYGTTVTELCKLNGISKTSTLSIGQSIRFRAKQVAVEASVNAIKQTTQATTQEKQTGLKNNQNTQTSVTSNTGKKIEIPIEETVVSNGPVYHRIQSGDTLYSLAKKYGTTIEKICELNDMKENIIIKVGRKIRCS